MSFALPRVALLASVPSGMQGSWGYMLSVRRRSAQSVRSRLARLCARGVQSSPSNGFFFGLGVLTVWMAASILSRFTHGWYWIGF